MSADEQRPKDATPHTCAHNRSALEALPFGDTQDFEDASRGFIGTLPEVTISNVEGRVIYSLGDYAFLAYEAAPDTVNPSLWRQARLNMNHGLFQVTDRIYQVRGFDISNMTIIEGSRGLIVIDPLISAEVARAGLAHNVQFKGGPAFTDERKLITLALSIEARWKIRPTPGDEESVDTIKKPSPGSWASHQRQNERNTP